MKLAADVSSTNSVALHAAGLSLFFYCGSYGVHGLFIMHNKQHLNRWYQLSGLVVESPLWDWEIEASNPGRVGTQHPRVGALVIIYP